MNWRLKLLDLLCILSGTIWAMLSCTFWGSACRAERWRHSMADLHDTGRKLQEVQLLKALRLELLDLPGTLAGSHLGRGVPAYWALYIDRGD